MHKVSIEGVIESDRETQGAAKTPYEKFNEIMNSLGRSEAWTVVFADLMNIPYSWHTLGWIIFLHNYYPYECVQKKLDPCHPKCEKIIYPSTRNVTNVLSEWKLVCGSQAKMQGPHSILTVGLMVGGLLFGHMADQHGRRPCFLFSCFIMVIMGLLAGATPWYWLYCITQFFIGFSAGGWVVCYYVFLVEFVPPKYRDIFVVMSDLPFCAGFGILALIAYVLPNWRHTQLVTSGVGIFCVAYIWILPESPRWLLLTGQIEKCAKVLKTSSRNANTSSEEILQIIWKANIDLREGDYPKTGGICDLFRTKKMMKVSFIIGLMWCFIFLIAFGMPYNTKLFEDDIYKSFAADAFVMAVGTMVAYPAIRYLKRRVVHVVVLGLASLILFAVPIISELQNHRWNGILSTISNGIIPITFPNLIIFGTEQYPTVLRSSGIGFGFCCGRIGTLIIPLVGKTKTIKAWIPHVLLGSLCVLTAALIFLLPETKGVHLADKFEGSRNKKNQQTRDKVSPQPSDYEEITKGNEEFNQK